MTLPDSSRTLLAFGCVFLGAGPAAAQPAPRTAVLEDYYRVETVNAPAISPDGRQVAFVRTLIVESENRRHSEIWLAPSDGSAPPRRLTSPAFGATAPRWSPDGQLLAFTSRRRVTAAGGPEDESVWFLRMDAAAGEAFRIDGVAGAPVFSPDNKWIAFIKAVKPETKAPAFARSEADKKIDDRFKGKSYDWMNARFDQRGYLPDPRDPLATPPEELFVVPREGGTPRQLTRLGVNVQRPAWRPDSGALAFVANLDQRDEHSYPHADLWTVDLAGQARRLTNDGFDYDTPAWSGDGGSLVALREQSLNQILAARQKHGSPTDLYRIALSGGEPVNLTVAWDLIPGVPRVGADGRHAYFSAGSSGSTHLFRVPLAGGTVAQVTQGERRLNDLSIAASASRIAYAAVDSAHASEAFSANLDGSEEKRLTSFNDSLLAELRPTRAERLRFASKDGTPIDGWLLMPNQAAAASRVPLILAIHGGPHGAYGNSFDFQFQLWVANGYAVLYTNPRGSTESGEKFLWATWGGWGGLDFEDVLAGVDHVVQRYAVDPKRLGVTGYSYGGFLTNWIITQTRRFAAASVGAGISNWVSDYGTADIPRTKETEFFGPPWEPLGGATLLKWSPVMHAGSVSTPTLFVHGESDLRVPIEQAEQMYTALKKRRVPAKFVRYPESFHGGWTPWNTVHRHREELAWWARYLKAPARD